MESLWAELPSDLLRQVMEKLCITSLISFKYVCRSWQSMISEEAELSLLRPVPSPPWLTIPPYQWSSAPASFYNLTDKKVYLCNKQWRPPAVEVAKCVGSCHGWLAYIDHLCVIYLTNPFKYNDVDDESPVVKLPSIETLPCILGIDEEHSSSPSCINFKYRLNEVTMMICITPSTDLFGFFISKLVMSARPFEKNCIVMVIYGNVYTNFIAYCKIGDTSWKTLKGGSRFYADLYYSSYNNRFYALCQKTRSIDVWEFHDSDITSFRVEGSKEDIPRMNKYGVPNIRDPLFPNSFPNAKLFDQPYLLELNGEILLAVKYITNATEDATEDSHNFLFYFGEHKIFKALYFDVYKMDSAKKNWRLVNCLGDYAAFLGVNNAVAFSVRDFPKLKRNSIYFTQENINPEKTKWRFDGSHGSGIFTFGDYKMHQCYHVSDHILKYTHLPNFTPLIWISPNLY